MRNLKVRHARVESGVMVVKGGFDSTLHGGLVYVDVETKRDQGEVEVASAVLGVSLWTVRVVKGRRCAQGPGFGSVKGSNTPIPAVLCRVK